MGVDTSKGWIAIPGIREHADRTIEEQMAGVWDAVKEAPGKTVLDLGAAEGAIGKEFAKAGAEHVLGVESLETHLAVARQYCADQPRMDFVCAYMEHYMAEHEPPERFDIVLCLGIAHKLRNPATLMRWAARACKDLFLFRAPAYAWNGWFEYKRGGSRTHVPTEMGRQGFALEKHIAGMRGEGVEYWRRKSSSR